jgi:hypothetical protein
MAAQQRQQQWSDSHNAHAPSREIVQPGVERRNAGTRRRDYQQVCHLSFVLFGIEMNGDVAAAATL